ncbi:SDR family NAD(P)-dependent oxidoreductase [Leifsonia naganoensis]|uniref:NAD(P)-dependent dehydrogenase (Short-subunit alcohol dehydrogenase family) n=1 Tax=Leifsonia naganoensis TaxID=150025 RepID=A0A853DT05_9MICO|nr:NAD(P)-dependent dehydrogenase (short-subunit alcohol dehydrogenase family) [Leifsonia naganoensis]
MITGAGRGLGREHALLFAREGARVLINDVATREGSRASDVVAEVEAAGGIAVANTDSATWEGASSIVGTAVDAWGTVDILINNATAGGYGNVWDFSQADWDRTIAVNLSGYFAMIRQTVPLMAAQGSGVIINTSSGGGFGLPGLVAYASAKEGDIGLTRTVAKEVGRFGIRCNAIRPLALAQSSDSFDEAMLPWARLMQATTGDDPATRGGTSLGAEVLTPPKIPPFVAWLCTDAAANVNGRTFKIGGDQVSLLEEPGLERTIEHEGGWTLDLLDAEAPSGLTKDLTNRWTLEDRPDLADLKKWAD